MPSVSVIIPVFGVEQYMSRCARSLFGQTLEDMEFIFIDDCTPDRSIAVMQEVLGEFPQRKEQVRVYRMPQNGGQAKVRMKGLELATGDYVIHCDSDDLLAPEAYERMYKEAISGGYDLVAADFHMGDDGAWKVCSTRSEKGRELADILTGKVMGNVWCRLVRRELLEGLVPPASNMGEDMVLTLQFTAKAHSIGHVDEPLYYYYVRPDSISHAPGMSEALARQEAFHSNARLCVDLLKERYGFHEREADVVFFKYRSRHYLEPYVHKKAVYAQWRNTFPEVDRQLLGTRGISFEVKFWYILIRLHLYHPWKVISGKHSLK